MKRLAVIMVVWAILPWVARAAGEDFTHSLTPADLSAAGLSGLSPEQLLRLNALVEAYKSGALAAARRAADEAQAAQRVAEAQAAESAASAAAAKTEAAQAQAKAALAKSEAAQAEVKAAEAKSEAAKSKQESQGLLAKAKAALASASKPTAVAVESTIPGKFRGWEPRQVFVLASGERCQVANNGSYFVPMVENPRVQLVPAAMAGYWLRFPDLDAQVRVNLIVER